MRRCMRWWPQINDGTQIKRQQHFEIAIVRVRTMSFSFDITVTVVINSMRRTGVPKHRGKNALQHCVENIKFIICKTTWARDVEKSNGLMDTNHVFLLYFSNEKRLLQRCTMTGLSLCRCVKLFVIYQWTKSINHHIVSTLRHARVRRIGPMYNSVLVSKAATHAHRSSRSERSCACSTLTQTCIFTR